MMMCKTCCQEYSAFDFVTLRNLCEHVYLDSLAQKLNHSVPESVKSSHGLTISDFANKKQVHPFDDLVSLDT
jgi:hypothetical protein